MKCLFTHVAWTSLFCCSILLHGCDAGVDLNNIDTSTSVKASFGLPIGSIRAELGDFIGDTLIPNISIHEDCYVYRDTFNTVRPFHPIDLSSYISNAHSSLNILEHMQRQHPELANLPYIQLPADTSFYVDFIMPFKFDGINSDLENQRMDSAIISQASFTSNITTEAFSTLTWDEIQRVEIILNPNSFRRPIMNLEVPIQSYGFGNDIPINVDDFHLIMMQNIHGEPSYQNIIDSTSFTIRFHFKTKRSHIITDEAAIAYSMHINFIEHKAIFGYFKASNKMRDDRQDVPFTEFWEDWGVLDGFILPVREPSVFIGIDHTMAIPLLVDLQSISIKSKTGEEKFATFDGSKEKQVKLPPRIKVTDPLTAHAYDTIRIDYTPANGYLEDVMTIHPDFLSYSYSVDADTTNTSMKQYRIVDDSDIHLSIGVDIPFKFNPGTKLFYGDTIKDINIEQFDLDSLIDEVEIIDTINDAKLILFLTFENYIPFTVTGTFEFLDEAGVEIPFEGVDSIALNYPTINNYIATAPGLYNLEIPVEREDLHKIASIKAIKYHITLGDNTDPVDLNTNTALRIYIGVTADLDAVLDFDSLFNTDNIANNDNNYETL